MSSVQHHELQEIADHAMASIADQQLLPQSHYVDVLLDLLVVAPSSIVRSAIVDRLSEIRFVSMLATDEVRADLYGIVAISNFSDAASDELTWAEQALMRDCTTCVAPRNAQHGPSSCSEVHAAGVRAKLAGTNTQHLTWTARSTNGDHRATGSDIDCQARASEFLTELIGSPPRTCCGTTPITCRATASSTAANSSSSHPGTNTTRLWCSPPRIGMPSDGPPPTSVAICSTPAQSPTTSGWSL